MWPSKTYDRIMAMKAREAKKARDFMTCLYVTTLSGVHPGQFNALPPSPEEIKGKAVLIGLTTWSEVWGMEAAL